MSAFDHSPDYPFGCTHQWGGRIGGVLPDMERHACNRQSGHGGECACKCGEVSPPPPGPSAPPRCSECGGPRSVGGAIRHHEWNCSVGSDGDRKRERRRLIDEGLRAALDAKRNDEAFMERLLARLAGDANILDRLADSPTSSAPNDGYAPTDDGIR